MPGNKFNPTVTYTRRHTQVLFHSLSFMFFISNTHSCMRGKMSEAESGRLASLVFPSCLKPESACAMPSAR